jgi:hypothetical protein
MAVGFARNFERVEMFFLKLREFARVMAFAGCENENQTTERDKW